jgi:hypothetical protein
MFYRPIRAFKKFNDAIAKHSVGFMSSIWCVYLFTFWAVLPSIYKSLEPIVFYISGGVIQLVALPLIMVGQKLEGRSMERRAEQDHEKLIEISQILEEIRGNRCACSKNESTVV